MSDSNDATNSTGNETSGVDTLVNSVKGAGNNLDWTLWLIGRITGATVILLIIFIPIIIYCRYKIQIKIMTEPLRKKVKAMCRCRKIGECLSTIICCRCCACGQRMSQTLGFQKLFTSSKMLRVTFLGASDIKAQLHFFVELWAEPQENAMQNTHTYQAIGSCDFGRTVRSIDWYGDEEEVVIRVVCFDSNRNIGELRIPRKDVQEFAKEAQGDPDDMSKGARAFNVMKISKPRSRMPDLDEVLVPLSQLQVVPDAQEFDLLKQENQKLKTQLAYVSAGSQPPEDTMARPTPPVLMSLVVRLEIVKRKPNDGGKFDRSMYTEQRGGPENSTANPPV